MTQARLAKLIGFSSSLMRTLKIDKTTQCTSKYNFYKISKILEVPIKNFMIF